MAEKNYNDCMKDLKDAQQTDFDNREAVREADLFINKRDGQWEPDVISKLSGKPRYTFDECGPIIDDIMGEMETMEFDIRVDPASGSASKDIAQAYEGIIRTIENISSARFVYNRAARIMIGTGLSGWRVISDYRDDDSFQQDLMIKSIPNFVDCVWFDPAMMAQDGSDANFCYVLSSMTMADYEKKYPKGSGLSVGQNRRAQAYSYKKPHEIVIGEYLYKKQYSRELALLSNGAVIEIDDSFNIIRDELQAAGITIEKTRKRPYYRVYQRLFDGGDWLTKASETVFDALPIIPVFGNFKISENKVCYHGLVEKIMDAQRIINYANSRAIEEGALSPRPKTWMTKDQAKSPDVRRTLRTLNTNADPVQFYDHVADQPPPFQHGLMQTNPGLIETMQNARAFIERTSSTFDEARGKAPAQRSGVAINMLQTKSDNPKRKWFSAMEIGLTQTFNVLVKAIPKVYDERQEMRLSNQDGSTKTITIKDKVQDQQTGQIIEIMDLSKGAYSITCSAGPAFTSRQQETVTTITELAAIDPSIIQIGADVLLNNINSPGIDEIAERKRMMMVNQGIIPPSQLTDEEKQAMAQRQAQLGQQQPSPIDQANLMIAQAQLEETQGKNQERSMKIELERQNLMLKNMELQAKNNAQEQKTMLDSVKAMTDQVKAQAEALKTIREAMGADAVMSPTAAAAYEGQARDLADTIAKN